MGTTAASVENGKAKVSKKSEGAAARLTERGVKVEFLNEPTLRAAAKKYLPAGKSKETDTPVELAAKLSDVFQPLSDEPHVSITCGDCGGKGPASDPACPFCGATDEQPGDATVPTTTAAAADVVHEAEVVDAPVAKGKKVKASADQLAVPAPMPAGAALLSVADLDAAVVEVNRLKGQAGALMWDMGAKLKEIFDANLWKFRVDEKGKSRYKQWQDFCREELGFADANATFRWMHIAALFDRPTAELVGRKKMELLLRAPDQEREGILEKVKAAALEGKPITAAVLKETVRESRERHPNNVRETGKSKGTQAATKAAAEKAKQKREAADAKITAVLTAKKITGRLFKADGGKYSVEDAKPAKTLSDSLADAPWGIVETENRVTGVVRFFKREDGTLGFDLRFKRDE